MLRIVQRAITLEWPVRLLSPLIGKFNPFLPEFRLDPYPQYRALRTKHPVYFSPSLRGWMLTRHADVLAVLQNPRFSANRTQSNLFKLLKPFKSLRPDFALALTRNLLMLDAPDHTRLRSLVNKAFTPRVIEQLRPRIQAVVDELLDRWTALPSVDLIRDLAYPLPIIVIAELLGVPTKDHAQLKKWSDELAPILDPFQAENGMVSVQAAFVELSAYFNDIFQQRRREPKDDLISALVNVNEQGDKLSDAELLSLSVLILGAGHETTTNLIGNSVLALLRFPAERRRLQDDPSMIRTAVEEFLRYDSPVQATDRVATEDCEIDGKRIRRGQLVGLSLGAANRDPAQFPDPDRLDVGRTENPHLAFSYGPHFCLGAALARAETQIAINSLLQRFPNFDGNPTTKDWKRSMVLRGPTALPLTGLR